jgi:hypothetical protein
MDTSPLRPKQGQAMLADAATARRNPLGNVESVVASSAA